MKFILGSVLVIVVIVGSFLVVFDRIESHKKEIAFKQAEEQRAIEARQLRRAELRKMEIQKESEKVKLTAQQEAEKAKLLAEKEAKEEGERIKTHPSRLAFAEKEVADANSICTPLAEKVKELKKTVAITQGQWATLEQTAKGLEKQTGAAKDTKDRAEGQYQTSRRGSGIGGRLKQDEREAARGFNRALTTKAAEARAEAERKKVALDLLKGELSEAEKNLAEAKMILQTKKDTLEAIKKEKL